MCTALENLKDEGRKEGRRKLLLTQTQKKLAKGFSIPEIADMLEEPEEDHISLQFRKEKGVLG